MPVKRSGCGTHLAVMLPDVTSNTQCRWFSIDRGLRIA